MSLKTEYVYLLIQDYGLSRRLRIETIIEVFSILDLHPQISDELIKEIILLYSNNGKEEDLEYITFMETMLHDIKRNLFI
jgi:hypothetical protein